MILLSGNYGIPDLEAVDKDGISKFFESDTMQIRGLVVHELSQTASHWNLKMTLDEWMYDEKVFNLNPLYLDDWGQLKDFGVETLVVYNNLIPYEELTSSSNDYKKVAIDASLYMFKYKTIEEIPYEDMTDELKERLNKLGIKIEDQESKESLLEKEQIHNEERQKVELALESFYRSAHSLCFQINKRYIPRYLSILRVIDRRFETGEIFIKWDEASDEDWLLLIYIKKNTENNDVVVIEDKSNPEQSRVYEFHPNEIFKASDVMVDALTKLLDSERNKRKVS